jgi:hypothetical protein
MTRCAGAIAGVLAALALIPAFWHSPASDEIERIEISIRDFPDYRVAFAPRTTEEDSLWRR